MSETTPNLALPLIMAAQAQKHVTHNEAIHALDALVHLAVLDRDLTAPPGAPAEGDRYIVKATATGAWAGQEGKVAVLVDGAWVFHAPKAGWVAFVVDENTLLRWSGSAWVDYFSGVALQNLSLLGVNTTADATNKLAVKSPAVLFDHNGAGSQVKVNKASAGDTASHLFQTGYSGRAEFGLTGDDDFHLKVSPDGAAWTEAMVVDKATGRLALPQTMSEEATFWLPYLLTDGLGTDFGVPTYTQREGWWWRIGNLVHAVFNIAFTTGTLSGSGNVVVYGLPFLPMAGTVYQAGGVMTPEKVTYPASALDMTSWVYEGDPGLWPLWNVSAAISQSVKVTDFPSSTAAVGLYGAVSFLIEPDRLAEHVAGGGFDDASGWTLGTDWVVSGGVASRPASSGASAIERTPAVALVEGGQYLTLLELTQRTAGSVRVRFSGGTDVNGTGRTAVGTYAQILTAAAGNNKVGLLGTDGNWNGAVDNFQMWRIA